MITRKLTAALFVSFILAGCGGKLDGTYTAGTLGMTSKMEFKSNGTVISDEMGMRRELKYEVDGNDLKLIAPQGTAIMRIIDDKTIEGPMGIRFVKS